MTNKTHPTYDASIHDQAPVRALSSVTLKQFDAVAEIARASGQDWHVQAGDDCDGYRFILIETANHGDEQKSFFIAGTAQRLELFESKDENLLLIGTFSDMQALEARLTSLIGPQQGQKG